MCEERMLWRSQIGQANKCSDAGTGGDLGVLTTHRTSPWFSLGDVASRQEQVKVGQVREVESQFCFTWGLVNGKSELYDSTCFPLFPLHGLNNAIDRLINSLCMVG